MKIFTDEFIKYIEENLPGGEFILTWRVRKDAESVEFSQGRMETYHPDLPIAPALNELRYFQDYYLASNDDKP